MKKLSKILLCLSSMMLLASCSFTELIGAPSIHSPSSGSDTGEVSDDPSEVDSETSDVSTSTSTSVNTPVESIKFEYSNYSLVVGDSHLFSVTVLPENATNKDITFSLSNSSCSIASSDNSGAIVVANKAGTCYLTARNKKSGVSAKCTITVINDSNGGFGSYTLIGTDPATYTVHSYDEFTDLLAIEEIKHYEKFRVLFGFNPTYQNLLNSQATDVHCELGSYSGTLAVNQTVSFNIEYNNDASIASTFAPRNHQHDYVELVNANFLLRQKRFESSKRSGDFTDFPITKSTKETLTVQNSEELWSAVSQLYPVSFAKSGCRAEGYYNKALEICKEYISDEMTDKEKVSTIFDYITSTTNYDYEVLDYSSNWQDYTAYYLEGFFDHDTCVCDGYSKVFALLCGIEGIEVRRAYGYTDDAGHAWNYVKLDGTWYLVCTTWGQQDYGVVKVENTTYLEGKNVTFHNYSALFNDSTYFYAASDGQYEFDQTIYPMTLDNTSESLDACDEPIASGSTTTFDVCASSEIEELCQSLMNAGVTQDFCINFPYNVSLSGAEFKEYLDDCGYDVNTILSMPVRANNSNYYIYIIDLN